MAEELKTATELVAPEGFNSGKFPLKKRELGGVQPFIKVGPFNVRLPLIHHEWSWTEMFAALFLGVACLGAGTATTMSAFGFDDPANIAALGLTENGAFLMSLSFGVFNAICYYLPSLLGDPVVPGWITPMLPLTLKYLEQWEIPNYATANSYNCRFTVQGTFNCLLNTFLIGLNIFGSLTLLKYYDMSFFTL